MIRRVQQVVAFVLALMMIAVPMSASAGTYTTGFGSHEIDYGNTWEKLESSDIANGQGEMITFVNKRDTALFLLGYVQSGHDPAEIRDAMIGGFREGSSSLTVIDQGEYDNVAYELDRTVMKGEGVGVFSLVVDRSATEGDIAVVMYVAQTKNFGSSMKSAQDTITVDGDPIFQGIDPASLEVQLGGTGTGTTDSTSPSDSKTSTSSSSNRSSSSTSRSSSQSSGSSRTSRSSSTSSSAGSYTNPQWGYTVTYGSEWARGSDVGEVSFTMMSPTTIVGIQGMDLKGYTPGEMWIAAGDDILATMSTKSTVVRQIVAADSVIIISTLPEGTFVTQYLQTPAGNYVMVNMLTTGSVDSVVATAQSTIQVDGVPIFANYQ